MRATLIVVGAFLIFAFPLVLLNSMAASLDRARNRTDTAAMELTPRSTHDLLRAYSARPPRDGIARRQNRELR